ncbi:MULTISPECIES: hypothetical protein [unclassified Streptomyces]|uniref:hypothetical protein n=1 Tax=unclassified Streptomyces TaxID=2593676 RepID=UPI003803494F
MLTARPATFDDAAMSRRVRAAVHTAVFTPEVPGVSADVDGTRASVPGIHVPPTADRLNAPLGQSPDPVLSAAGGAP